METLTLDRRDYIESLKQERTEEYDVEEIHTLSINNERNPNDEKPVLNTEDYGQREQESVGLIGVGKSWGFGDHLYQHTANTQQRDQQSTATRTVQSSLEIEKRNRVHENCVKTSQICEEGSKNVRVRPSSEFKNTYEYGVTKSELSDEDNGDRFISSVKTKVHMTINEIERIQQIVDEEETVADQETDLGAELKVDWQDGASCQTLFSFEGACLSRIGGEQGEGGGQHDNATNDVAEQTRFCTCGGVGLSPQTKNFAGEDYDDNAIGCLKHHNGQKEASGFQNTLAYTNKEKDEKAHRNVCVENYADSNLSKGEGTQGVQETRKGTGQMLVETGKVRLETLDPAQLLKRQEEMLKEGQQNTDTSKNDIVNGIDKDNISGTGFAGDMRTFPVSARLNVPPSRFIITPSTPSCSSASCLASTTPCPSTSAGSTSNLKSSISNVRGSLDQSSSNNDKSGSGGLESRGGGGGGDGSRLKKRASRVNFADGTSTGHSHSKNTSPGGSGGDQAGLKNKSRSVEVLINKT
jgi:hypothetical protein